MMDEGLGEAPRNLTELADQYGSDKGSTKHRYTELYHMLFNRMRADALTFVEMGLLIGGPEHGVSNDRRTRDVPSIRMWLDYFPRGHVIGMDVSDFSWFTHPRFTFRRCDMDVRDELRAARAALPDCDVILDDASHASHHQQTGFLELFPKLKPGGLYVIEDLRWQPETYEVPGITKTAALFRSYLETGAFRHADPECEAAFNAMRSEISGCFVFKAKYRLNTRDQVAVIHKR